MLRLTRWRMPWSIRFKGYEPTICNLPSTTLDTISSFEFVCFWNDILYLFEPDCIFIWCNKRESSKKWSILSELLGLTKALSKRNSYSLKFTVNYMFRHKIGCVKWGILLCVCVCVSFLSWQGKLPKKYLRDDWTVVHGAFTESFSILIGCTRTRTRKHKHTHTHTHSK